MDNTHPPSLPLTQPKPQIPAPTSCAVASGSSIQDFRNEVMGQFVDYFPKAGETCEYQREVGKWIPCEIIREHSQKPTRYRARYVSHTGQIKTGIVGACNLRPSSQNKAVMPSRPEVD